MAYFLCPFSSLPRGTQIQKVRRDASSVSGLSSFLKRSVPAATYPIGGDSVLSVDGATREGAAEVLFERDGDGASLSTMVLDAVLASPIDTRRELAANLVSLSSLRFRDGFPEYFEIRAGKLEAYYSLQKLKKCSLMFVCWERSHIFSLMVLSLVPF